MDFRRKVLKNNPILNGEFKVYANLFETLCQNLENVHKLKCLQRNCENCGVNNLNLMEEEKVDKEQLPVVQWERYEYVNLKRGLKSIRKLMLVKKTSKPYEMFSYFFYRFFVVFHTTNLAHPGSLNSCDPN